MISLLGAGVALGLSAGISPGPLLALVISQTMKHGSKEGAKVAAAPLITDVPIIIGSTALVVNLSRYGSLFGFLSLAGGCFLVFLAYENFRTGGLEMGNDRQEPKSLIKGAIVNALSPYPYLFWITVGAPMMVRGSSEGLLSPLLFIVGFLGCLVGSKIALAVFVGKSKPYLTGKPYVYAMRVLGVALLVFAFFLFRDGVHLISRS
ncbi:MAG TPA: LysE family translocator [Candidatus Deferrimicrobiaceae bacterium]|nr:LysE family translocator [Candidatus Deferrimicrobiaceae bacterium]